jgi:threonine dehydratase
VANPFLDYRPLLHSYQIGRAHGIGDSEYSALVGALDAAVARVDGGGFRSTPFMPAARLADGLGLERGSLWVKDETGNVSGSHKARHLMGLALWLEVATRLWPASLAEAPRLAIASCGNAALGAAVVARAAGRPLDVFVPPWANRAVVDRLTALGADLVTCRREDSTPGDPCFHRFLDAVQQRALPFTCQGSQNGLVIEGGKTLVWEMISELMASGHRLDHLFIQVGGGALASACIQGLQEASSLDLLDRLPAVHTVQTRGGYPLHRAWHRVVSRLLDAHRNATGDAGADLVTDLDRARFIRDRVSSELVCETLQYAATHRSQFMWPWEDEPKSIATGILDDETYDWLSVVEGMLVTGGVPLVVAEETLGEAHLLAHQHTGIPVEPTGTAGLAGLLALRELGGLPAGEISAVLFTGVER